MIRTVKEVMCEVEERTGLPNFLENEMPTEAAKIMSPCIEEPEQVELQTRKEWVTDRVTALLSAIQESFKKNGRVPEIWLDELTELLTSFQWIV